MSNRIQNAGVHELVQREPVRQRAIQPGSPSPAQANEFAALLQDKLRISGHAQTRLQSRNIELGRAEWARVMEGVDKAAQKGARESLVMIDDVALVVSVKNRTVITAVDKAQLKENVFTNIDSAVIV